MTSLPFHVCTGESVSLAMLACIVLPDRTGRGDNGLDLSAERSFVVADVDTVRVDILIDIGERSLI